MNQELLSKLLNGDTAKPPQEPTAEEPKALFRQAWPWAIAPAVIVLATLLVIGADIMTVLTVTGSILGIGALLTFILVFSER